MICSELGSFLYSKGGILQRQPQQVNSYCNQILKQRKGNRLVFDALAPDEPVVLTAIEGIEQEGGDTVVYP
jgi:hypothetical protein